MVKVIMGLKGAGKTKKLIDLIHKATEEEHGDVVCIERDAVMTYDIPHSVRLCTLSQYKNKGGYVFLKGFISGLQAGNYDITHIFMDSLTKLSGSDSIVEIEEFLGWLEAFSDRENVKFTLTISADASLATPGIQKYM